MPERAQPLMGPASGDGAPSSLPFLLRGGAEEGAGSDSGGDTGGDTGSGASSSGGGGPQAAQHAIPPVAPLESAAPGPQSGDAVPEGAGGLRLAVAAGDGAAADGAAARQAADADSERAAALQAAGAASVEAAAFAVVRAAAAVEAVAGTVQSAAAAVDMAAAALAFAGRSARSAERQAWPLAHLPAQNLASPHALSPHSSLVKAPALQTPVSQAPASHALAVEAVSMAAHGVQLADAPAAASGAPTGALLARPRETASPRWQARLAGATIAADPRARFRRVAIIHYWLVTMRGGERVLERLLQLFPGADIFTHVYDPAAMSDAIRAHTVHTSFIQKLPGARRHYQAYLPLMPLALEQLDLRGYDLVISSESGPAKGVIAAPDALHMCYVHSPMRYLWDHYHDYRNEAGWLKRAAMPLLCHGLRQWDTASAARVDRILANSNFIRERVAKAWRREAEVVHPPVDPALFTPTDEVDPGYLWVGQLVPYKRADLAIDAFNALGLPLTVVGDGPQAAALRKRAGPTIRMIPRLNFDELRRAYARCRALVFTAEEDFGIVPVEVMASGRPVIAYGRGGALDSVVAERTGLFFAEQTTEALVEAVRRLEAWMPHFDPAAALARARDFAPEHFDRGVLEALA